MKTQQITFGYNYRQINPSPIMSDNLNSLARLASLNPEGYPNLIRKVGKYSAIKKMTSNEMKSLIDISKLKPEFKAFESGFFIELKKLEKALTLSEKVKFLAFLENSAKILKEMSL